MKGKSKKKRRKTREKYLEAPSKSRASCFFASFFITAALLMSGVGLFLVNRNSKKVGFGEDVQAFSVTKSTNWYDITVVGKKFSLDRYYVDGTFWTLDRINFYRMQNEPEPFYFFDNVSERIIETEFGLLSAYDPVKWLLN